MRKRKKGTKAERVRQWLADHPKGNRQQFTTDTGISIHTSQFAALKRAANGGNGDVVKGSKPPSSEDQIQFLQEHTKFLEWCLIGERKGWVDLLLEKINNS